MYYNSGISNVQTNTDKNCLKLEAIELFLQLHQMIHREATVEVLSQRTEGVSHILRLELEELVVFVEALKERILLLESRQVAEQDDGDFGVDTTVFTQSELGPDF